MTTTVQAGKFDGESFTNIVIITVNAIPEGMLSTYGAIASAAGYSGYARQIGHILKNLPEHSTIPWHRVINAQGKSSFPEGSEKHHQQVAKLVAEGHPSSLGTKRLKTHHWPIAM